MARRFDYSSTFDDQICKFDDDVTVDDDDVSEVKSVRWCRCEVVLLVVTALLNAAVGTGFYFTTAYFTARPNDNSIWVPETELITASSLTDLARERSFFLTNVSHTSNLPGKITGWTDRDVTGTHRDDVILENDTFRIQSNGYYQLYSHLSFRAGDSTSALTFTPSNSTLTFRQTIKRQHHKSNTTEEVLSDECARRCDSADVQVSCYTSIIFSAVKLNPGDRVHLKTDVHGLIDRREGRSFFAIYKLR